MVPVLVVVCVVASRQCVDYERSRTPPKAMSKSVFGRIQQSISIRTRENIRVRQWRAVTAWCPYRWERDRDLNNTTMANNSTTWHVPHTVVVRRQLPSWIHELDAKLIKVDQEERRNGTTYEPIAKIPFLCHSSPRHCLPTHRAVPPTTADSTHSPDLPRSP
jgi:hypothetical protein